MPEAPRALTVAAAGFVLGILTSYAQGWLPSEMGSLANSSGPWALVPFGLALLGRSWRSASLFGALALAALLAGYVAGSDIRGYATGHSLVLFWGAAAIVVGPLLGLGAHWVKTGRGVAAGGRRGGDLRRPHRRGVYGLAYISGATYTPTGGASSSRAPPCSPSAASAGFRAFRPRPPPGPAPRPPAACVAVYSLDLIGVLP
jgi:hypothetical protein